MQALGGCIQICSGLPDRYHYLPLNLLRPGPWLLVKTKQGNGTGKLIVFVADFNQFPSLGKRPWNLPIEF